MNTKYPYLAHSNDTPANLGAEGFKSGGGDGGGEMEARVKALEDKFDKIDGRLVSIGSDMSYLRGKSEAAPSAKDFGELKGRVDSLPTTAKLATLLGIAVAAITILNNWDKISVALFGV